MTPPSPLLHVHPTPQLILPQPPAIVTPAPVALGRPSDARLREIWAGLLMCGRKKGRGQPGQPDTSLPGGGGTSWTTIATANYTDGTFGDFANGWGDSVVMDDPTGLLNGKVCRVPYAISAANEYDSDRGVQYDAPTATQWLGFGQTGRLEGEFVVPAGSITAMRKLFYWFPPDAAGTSSGFVVVGDDHGYLYTEYCNNGVALRIPPGGTYAITKGVKNTLAVEVTVNSAYNVADGAIRVYLNSVLCQQVTGVIVLNNSGTFGGSPNRFEKFRVGAQLQESGQTVSEYRYWDNLAYKKAA